MKIDLNNVLITGGYGMVGSYIDFGIKTGRDSLDITSMFQVEDFVNKYKPEVILHLAAETDLAKCESEPAHAYLVNAVGTYNLATAAKKIGAKMVYVSTDAVFSTSKIPHTTQDEPQPESVYGHSKYLGELAVKGISQDYIIARTSWIFGGGRERDKKFIGKFIPQLDNAEAKAVNDQINTPTYAKDLVQSLKKLIIDGESGLFHLANAGSASRYDMALETAKCFDKNITISPVSSALYGSLPHQQSSGGIMGNQNLRSWQEALKEYIETEWKSK